MFHLFFKNSVKNNSKWENFVVTHLWRDSVTIWIKEDYAFVGLEGTCHLKYIKFSPNVIDKFLRDVFEAFDFGCADNFHSNNQKMKIIFF